MGGNNRTPSFSGREARRFQVDAEFGRTDCGFEILKRAFATTSMQTLLVAQTPEFEWDKEILRVSPDVHSGELVFDFRKPGPICSNTGTGFDAVRLKRVSRGSKDFSRSRSGLSYTRSSPQWTRNIDITPVDPWSEWPEK